jgi:uncharacterized protein YqcC (DUF446 family)
MTTLCKCSDCKDGHKEFTARKSLEFIVDDLQTQDNLQWVCVDKTIMFDDDASALPAHEANRLVTVPSYDHWEACEWDENVNEEMLARNPSKLARIVRARSFCTTLFGASAPGCARR